MPVMVDKVERAGYGFHTQQRVAYLLTRVCYKYDVDICQLCKVFKVGDEAALLAVALTVIVQIHGSEVVKNDKLCLALLDYLLYCLE